MRTVVGVLRGGPSSEYEISLQSGANVLSALDTERYEPRDLFVDREGVWHVHGVPAAPERALRGVDVVFNVIHGEYGEDGQVQRILEAIAVPYTGSRAEVATLVFNKHRTNEAAKALGIRVPHSVLLHPKGDAEGAALSIFRSFPLPAVVKPVTGGSSVGMSVARDFHSLVSAIELASTISPGVLVEEFIKGKEATVGVIDDFRGQKTYALMPIEIIPPASQPFFNYGAKYSGETIERVPGNFTRREKQELEDFAKRAHEGLGVPHFSRSDFIVSPRGIYFLEINNAQAVGMTSQSLLPKALEAAGIKVSDFLHHVVTLAL